MDALKQDIKLRGVSLDETEWRCINKRLLDCTFPKGSVILSQARVADHWLFLKRGIVASEQSNQDGNALIARFFEAGHFCSNLTSVWGRQLASDNLVAITNVEGCSSARQLVSRTISAGQRFWRVSAQKGHGDNYVR